MPVRRNTWTSTGLLLAPRAARPVRARAAEAASEAELPSSARRERVQVRAERFGSFFIGFSSSVPLEPGEQRGEDEAVVEGVEVERERIVVDVLLQHVDVLRGERLAEEARVDAPGEAAAIL